MVTIRYTPTAGPRHCGRLASRLLSGAAIVTPLLMLGLSANTRAQTADVARLQAESAAFNAQLRSLENKMRQAEMRPPPPPPGAHKPPAVPQEPPFFADRKLHLGGITISPGGFLAVENPARDQ